MKANHVKEVEAFLKSLIPETAPIEYKILEAKRDTDQLRLYSSVFYSWYFEPITKALDKFENVKFWIDALYTDKGAVRVCINFYLTT